MVSVSEPAIDNTTLALAAYEPPIGAVPPSLPFPSYVRLYKMVAAVAPLSTTLLRLLAQSNMEFDYEVNTIKNLDYKNEFSQVYFLDKMENSKNYGKIIFLIT